MKTITIEKINLAIDAMEGEIPEEISSKFRNYEETIMTYLLNNEMEVMGEENIDLIISMSLIVTACSDLDAEKKTFDEGILQQLEDENWGMLEDREVSTLEDALQTMKTEYPQPAILNYFADILKTDEEQMDTSESIIMLVCFKTITDAIIGWY